MARFPLVGTYDGRDSAADVWRGGIMTGIEITNLADFLAGLEEKKARIRAAMPELMGELGQLVVENMQSIHPPEIRTGQYNDSLQYKVEEGDDEWSLWAGSVGAFSKDGYNYATLLEYRYSVVSIGWFMSQPEFADRWSAKMSEALNG